MAKVLVVTLGHKVASVLKGGFREQNIIELHGRKVFVKRFSLGGNAIGYQCWCQFRNVLLELTMSSDLDFF